MKQKCPYFDSCSAPLCPMENEEELKKAIWYPDEEVCRRRGLNHPWLKAQKKIARRAKHSDGYFTIQMLTHPCRICKGIEGLDPDKEEGPQLEKWFKKHPVLKPTKRGLRGNFKPALKGGFMVSKHAGRGGLWGYDLVKVF